MKCTFLSCRCLLLLLTLLLGLSAQAQPSINYTQVDLNTANAGRAAYLAGDYEAATAYFAQLLPRPAHLQQYYFGVLMRKAIGGDTAATRYISKHLSNDSLYQLTAPLRIYLQLRDGQSDRLSAQAAFEMLDFSVYYDYPVWQLHASLALFACMDGGSDTSFTRRQLRNLQLRLPKVEATKSEDDWPDTKTYLSHLYHHEAGKLGFTLTEDGAAFVPLQHYNLRRLALYQAANPHFLSLDELLAARLTTAHADARQKLLLLLFSNPSGTYFEQWLQLEGVEQLSSIAIDSLLTSNWSLWPHADLLQVLYPAEQLGGRWLLIDVWGSWCSPCRAQLPQLQQLKSQLDSLNNSQLRLLTLVDRTPRLEQFMEEHGYDFPTAVVNTDQVHALGIAYFPTTWLISPSGKYLQLRDWPALHPWLFWLASRN